MPRTTTYAERPKYHDEGFRSFVGRVKLRLFQLDITQAELARRLDIDHATVSGWMSLKYMPQFLVLPKIGDALECDIGWLMTGEGSPDRKQLTEHEGQFQGASLALTDMQNALDDIARAWRDKTRKKRR